MFVIKPIVIGFFGAAFIIQSSFAGAISGGGGKSVVCSKPDGTIQSAELLDLYEGAVEYGYPILDSNAPFSVQVAAAIERIGVGRDADFRSALRRASEFVQDRMHLLPDGTGLVPIDDSYEVIVPKNCQVFQLANFMDDQQMLLVDGRIWAQLSETNKAALIVHESLYWYLRMMARATNSVQARQAVALTFASTSDFSAYDADLPSNAWHCETAGNLENTPGTKFWAYPNGDGNITLQFDTIEDEPMLSKTTAEIGHASATDTNLTWVTTSSIFPKTQIAIQFSLSQDGLLFGLIGHDDAPVEPTAQFQCSQ